MKSCFLKRSAAILLIVAAVLVIFPASALAAGGSIVATGYYVSGSSGGSVSRITQGSVVDITVSVKDTSLTTDKFNVNDLDVSKLVDSFSGGSITTNVTSQGTSPLTYNVRLSGLKYSGTGKSLKLMIGTKGEAASYETIELSVSEAVEYEAPKPSETPAPEAAPAPMVIISRSDIPKPLEAGQETDVTLFFRNISNIKLTSPIVSVNPSDALSIVGGASTFTLPDIPGNRTGSITVRIKAAANIQTPGNQALGVDLKYNYFNNVALVHGEASDKVTVPALGRESVSQPVVLVTRSPVSKPISAGDTLDVTISFKNLGATRLVSPVAYVSSSDALIVMNEATTFVLPDIEPGKNVDIVVRVKAAKEISSTNQSISTELKFSYDNGGTMTAVTTSDKVNIAANTTSPATDAKPDSSVPSIIISSFEYGGESVAAGKKFTLRLSFENTGKLKIENIVVTVDGGESFTMDDSTNTFFYNALGAGGKQQQEVPMQALVSAKSGAQNVGVSFKYDYLDGQKRASASADIKISIPVFQPDRFQINAPVLPDAATVGEELALSLSYVNKGKGDIANVEATVIGDDVDTPAKTQYLGNIAAGASGNIGFAVTPNKAGDVNITLKVTYEDADQKVQVKEFPVKLPAAEPAPIEEIPEEGAESEGGQGGLTWLWIGLAAVVLGGGGAFVIIRRKKRARPAKKSDEDWDDWDQPGGSDTNYFSGDGTKEE